METRFSKSEKLLAVRLDKGDEVIASLQQACEKHGIKSGLVFGIGTLSFARLYAVKSAETAAEKKEWETGKPLELLSGQGNLTQKEGKAFIHLHVVLGDHEGKTMGGHLMEGRVSLTGEFFVLSSAEIGRRFNEGTKLWNWKL